MNIINYLKSIILALTATVLIAGASAGCGTNNPNSDGDNEMKTTTRDIPKIDTMAPVNTETATFALG
jgi:hypothetical protein